MNSKDWLDRGFAFILSFQLILGFLQMLDYFGVVYYPTVNRLTEEVVFSLGFSLILPMMFLMLAWCMYFFFKGRRGLLLIVAPLIFGLVNLELTISLVTILMFCVGLYYYEERSDFSRVFIGLITFVNFLAVVHWGMFVPLGLPSPLEWLAMLMLDIFYVFSVLAPLLVLPILFIGILKLFLRSGFNLSIFNFQVEEKEMTTTLWGCLAFSIFIGVFASVYPWLPTVNPEMQNIGVDVRYYLDWVGQVQNDWSKLFDVSWGSRPLMILIIMGVKMLTGYSLSNTVYFMPVILMPLLVLSVFFMTWHIYKNSEVAVWASFFTASGLQVTVGLYSYFLTNILALSMVSVSLGLFFKSLKESSYYYLSLAAVFGGVVIFTHPWTFDQYFSPLIFVVLILYYNQRKSGGINNIFKMLVLFLTLLGFFEVVRVFLFRGMGGLGATQTLLESILRYEGFWDGSIFFFRFYYGGFMSYVLLFMLVLIGLFHMPENKVPSLYFLYLFGLTGFVFLFASGPLKSRLIYNLPLGIFASLGLFVILKRCNFRIVYKLFLFSSSLNYLFMCIANI